MEPAINEVVAAYLLEIKAVFLRPNEPFTWASGIKAPIYCDNRIILSFPHIRSKIEEALATIIKNHYPSCDILAGTSTAGIAHTALVANILNLPMIYVRNNEKNHGRKNLIEGQLNSSQNAVVIEDLISTAGSAINVVNTVKAAGIDVLGIASIFTYGLQAGIDAIKQAKTTNISLSNYNTLVNEAFKRKLINNSDYQKLQAFIKDPNSNWINL
ncbi:MAG: orotate phosphoribosyltransferase [Oscillospiraceae bacterium]|jgi:orotate phosphoribosyltransferase|nr:orotate phosphoribosyltransferase [Oscillospiraceae bacterium]